MEYLVLLVLAGLFLEPYKPSQANFLGGLVKAVAGPLVGGLLGGNKQSTTTTSSVNYEQMVRSAQAAGFNPLTALRNGGSAGFATTNSISSRPFLAEVGAAAADYIANPHQQADAELARELDRARLENIRAQTKAMNSSTTLMAAPDAPQSWKLKPEYAPLGREKVGMRNVRPMMPGEAPDPFEGVLDSQEVYNEAKARERKAEGWTNVNGHWVKPREVENLFMGVHDGQTEKIISIPNPNVFEVGPGELATGAVVMGSSDVASGAIAIGNDIFNGIGYDPKDHKPREPRTPDWISSPSGSPRTRLNNQ